MRQLGVVGVLVLSILVFMGPGRCGADDDGNNNSNNNNNTVEPDQDAQDAIAVAADVLEANRVAAELTNSASEGDDAVSPKANGCPTVTRVDTSLTLDYGSGCSPAAGWVPYDMSGSITLAMDVSARSISGVFDGLTYGPYSLDGDISAAYSREPGLGMDFTEQLDLTFTEGANSLSVVQDLTLTVRSLFLEIDGTVDYDDGADNFTLDVQGVRWNYEDLNLTCPLPIAGSVEVQVGMISVTLTFDLQSPTTGIAHVESTTMSGDVNVCAWWYAL